MKNENELTASDRAVMHIVKQIQTRPIIRYFFGWGSESFHLICQAIMEITGKSEEDASAGILIPLKCRECGGSSGRVQRLENDAYLECCKQCHPELF